MRIDLAGETVELLPERALFWPRQGALFIADTHWGKAATFRSQAIPVPVGSTRDDLERLSDVLRRTGAERLVILGDLLHAPEGRRPETFDAIEQWRAAWPGLRVLLVRGNHDRRAGDPPPEWGFEVANEPFAMPPFALRHYPCEEEGLYCLAGHTHPKIGLRGLGGEKITAPCFQVGARVAVLPAFSSFAAGGLLQPQAGERYFLIADDEVLEAPLQLAR
jgi:DNA ligase-associated metallophosphoesterase